LATKNFAWLLSISWLFLAYFLINTEIINFSKIVCHPSVKVSYKLCYVRSTDGSITLSGIPDVRKYPIGIITLSLGLRGSPRTMAENENYKILVFFFAVSR
jgi:hypothetical protein